MAVPFRPKPPPLSRLTNGSQNFDRRGKKKKKNVQNVLFPLMALPLKKKLFCGFPLANCINHLFVMNLFLHKKHRPYCYGNHGNKHQ